MSRSLLPLFLKIGTCVGVPSITGRRPSPDLGHRMTAGQPFSHEKIHHRPEPIRAETLATQREAGPGE